MLGSPPVAGIFHVGRENEFIPWVAHLAGINGLRPVHLTDLDTPSSIDTFRRKIGGELMIKNIGLQLEWMKENPVDTVFIDSDVLIMRDISHVFDMMRSRNCCLGVTFRRKRQFPINYGVIFAAPGSVPFFEFLKRNAISQPEDRRKWYANQFAVVDLFPSGFFDCKHPFSRFPSVFRHELGNILVLSADEYNFSPDDPGKISSQHIVHFKGERKSFMGKVYQRACGHLSRGSQGKTDITCQGT